MPEPINAKCPPCDQVAFVGVCKNLITWRTFRVYRLGHILATFPVLLVLPERVRCHASTAGRRFLTCDLHAGLTWRSAILPSSSPTEQPGLDGPDGGLGPVRHSQLGDYVLDVDLDGPTAN